MFNAAEFFTNVKKYKQMMCTYNFKFTGYAIQRKMAVIANNLQLKSS